MELVVLTQDQCRYCHSVTAFLDDQEVTYKEINVTHNPEAIEEYDIMSTPTILLMDGDEEVTRTTGFSPSELETLIDNL